MVFPFCIYLKVLTKVVLSALIAECRVSAQGLGVCELEGINLKRFEILLLFNEKPSWPTLLDPPSLHYTSSVYEPNNSSTTQPVLKDRLILKPDIDLNRYRCRAVLDWVEVQIEMTGMHQAINIQRFASKVLVESGSTSKVYVSGPTRNDRYTGSSFIVRMQQPEFFHLGSLCTELLKKYPTATRSAGDLAIAGIEVSVDFYVKNQNGLGLDAQNLLRWQMTEVLRRHLRPGSPLTELDENHPRFFATVNGKSTSKPVVSKATAKASGKQRSEIQRLGLNKRVLAPLRIGAHEQAPIDTTFYIGKKDSAVMLRVMDKTTDRRDPRRVTAVDLPPAEFRSRIEVAFIKKANEFGGPAAIGLETLKDLVGYPFKSIRKLVFEFFYPTTNSVDKMVENTVDEMADLLFPVKVTELDVFSLSGVYGLDRLQRSIAEISDSRYRKGEIPTKPRSIGSKGKAVSFEELNRKIDRSLVRLSRDWTSS